MKYRFRFALIGLGVGFFTGFFAGLTVWTLAISTSEGVLRYFLWTLGSFMVTGALIGFLFPKKAGDYFWQFMVGMVENLSI